MTVHVQQDGRIARRERNQDQVLDAVVELFSSDPDGVPELVRQDMGAEPTVEEIALWSGVSTRSIYRYFHHREGLIEAALWHLVDRLERELPLHVGDGSFADRLAAFIEHRLEVYRRVAPLVRSLQQAPVVASTTRPTGDPDHSALSAEKHPNGVLGHQLTKVFHAEFAAIDDDDRREAIAIIDMATAFESLEHLLRSFHGDYEAIVVTLTRLVNQQLGSIPEGR